MAATQTHEQVVHEALEVVLQQPLSDAWDVKTLCSLLQVSTTCRKAVFDSGVSCALSARHFLAASGGASLQRIMGFASWLPNHAPLVSSLELCAPQTITDTPVAEQLLTMAVKLCAQQQALPAQSRTPTGLIQPLAGLRLQSLTGNLLLQPAALAALASCSHLTRLCWRELQHGALSAPVLHALGQLTGLKSLALPVSARNMSQQYSTHLAAALAKLQQLERLECALAASCLPQLPFSLVSMRLRLPNARPAAAADTLDLGHLTALQSLDLTWVCRGTVPSVLPSSLSSLSVIGASIGADVQSLPKLVSLDMTVDITQPNLLQRVHGMPLLRKLVLGLSHLFVGTPVTEGHAQAVAAALAAATQVTCLELFRHRPNSSLNVWQEDDAAMLLHNSLLQMRTLSSLLVEGFRLDPRDVLGWTSLSALSSLSVAECSGFTDTAVAALACKLPGLQFLEVDNCGISSPVSWPALACCTSLVDLAMRGHALPLQDEVLSSLTRLTSLVLVGSDLVVPSAAAVQQFRVAMPQLRNLHGLQGPA